MIDWSDVVEKAQDFWKAEWDNPITGAGKESILSSGKKVHYPKHTGEGNYTVDHPDHASFSREDHKEAAEHHQERVDSIKAKASGLAADSEEMAHLGKQFGQHKAGLDYHAAKAQTARPASKEELEGALTNLSGKIQANLADKRGKPRSAATIPGKEIKRASELKSQYEKMVGANVDLGHEQRVKEKFARIAGEREQKQGPSKDVVLPKSKMPAKEAPAAAPEPKVKTIRRDLSMRTKAEPEAPAPEGVKRTEGKKALLTELFSDKKKERMASYDKKKW